MTNVATQGDTYNDCPISLTDIDFHYYKSRPENLLVGLSRSNDLDNITLFSLDILKVNDTILEKIIDNK